MNRIMIAMTFLGFSLVNQTALAGNSFRVFSSLTPINYGGKTEVLGGISITVETSGISAGDTIQFHFAGLVIANPFSGNISVNPATGLAAAPGGITLGTSGGWRNAAVYISMDASPDGDSVSVSFPAGLTIDLNDWISLNGVRTDVSRLPVGAEPGAQISSLSSTFNTTNISTGIISPSLSVTAEAGYAIGCQLTGPAPRVDIKEGFISSFVQNVPAPLNPRSLYGATGNTQIRLSVSNLPVGVKLDWSDSVNEAYSSLIKKEQTDLGDQVLYDYRSNDQGISDQVQESFSIQPSLQWDSTVYKGTAVIQAQLYPAATSESVPRFDYPLEPAYGLEFLTVGYTPGEDATPPQVQIISPADGAIVYTDVTASAFARDDGSVSGVQFFLDGVPYGSEIILPPYSVVIKSSALPTGNHALMAQARDRGGHSSFSAAITIKKVSAISLASITPSAGPASGGTGITLTGSGFKEGATLVIGGTPASITQLTPELVTAQTSAAFRSGNADIVLTNPDGGQARLSAAFDYTASIPALDRIEPDSRTALDAPFSLTVLGNQFTRGTLVLWDGSPRVTRFLSSQMLEATITTADLAVAGTALVGVSSEGAIAAATKSFTILPVSGNPSYLSILPVSGSGSGHEKISLFGSGFKPEIVPADNSKVEALSGDQLSLSLGGKPLTHLMFVNQGQIDAQTPDHTPGDADLAIQDCCGTKLIPKAYRFRNLNTLASHWSLHAAPATRLWIPLAADTVQFRTNLGLNNPQDKAATVDILLINPAGEILSEKSATIPAHGLTQINHVLRFLEGQETLTGREGYLVLESEDAIKAWASLIDNISNDPVIFRSYPEAEADEQIIIPSSADSAGYKTELLIVNTTIQIGFITIRSYGISGGTQATLENLPIGPNGWIHFEDFYQKAGVRNVFGPLVMEASPGVKILGGARIYTPQKTGGYLEGISTRYAGGIIKIPHSIDTLDSRTNLGISNAGSAVAAVTVTLLDEQGAIRGSQNLLVSPHGMVQLNNVNRILLNQDSLTNSIGSLSLSSFQPIVGWISEIDNRTQDLSFSTSGQFSLHTRFLIPSVTRTGEFHSTLTILNAGIQPAQVRLTAYNIQGLTVLSRLVNVPAGGQFNTSDVLGYLNLSDSYGPLELESLEGEPILVTSQVKSSQSTSGVLNGQPLE